jgi:hypothetical protein
MPTGSLQHFSFESSFQRPAPPLPEPITKASASRLLPQGEARLLPQGEEDAQNIRFRSARTTNIQFLSVFCKASAHPPPSEQVLFQATGTSSVQWLGHPMAGTSSVQWLGHPMAMPDVREDAMALPLPPPCRGD